MVQSSLSNIQKTLETLKNLDLIDILSTKNVKKLQYFIVYGNLLKQFGRLKDSLKTFIKALEIIKHSSQAEKLIKQKANILYEIGKLHYYIGVQELKKFALKGFSENKRIFH